MPETKTKKTVGYENNEKKMDSVYSKRVKAGKRRTYFFDVKATRSNDFYLTITESRKRFNEETYERHKIFLYKEDFNKFLKGLSEAVDFVKTDLMPDFDFDAFNHEYAEGEQDTFPSEQPIAAAAIHTNGTVVNHSPVSLVTGEATEPVESTLLASEAAETNGFSANGHHEEVDKW